MKETTIKIVLNNGTEHRYTETNSCHWIIYSDSIVVKRKTENDEKIHWERAFYSLNAVAYYIADVYETK